jgi:hypothetical protein
LLYDETTIQSCAIIVSTAQRIADSTRRVSVG